MIDDLRWLSNRKDKAEEQTHAVAEVTVTKKYTNSLRTTLRSSPAGVVAILGARCRLGSTLSFGLFQAADGWLAVRYGCRSAYVTRSSCNWLSRRGSSSSVQSQGSSRPIGWHGWFSLQPRAGQGGR